MPHGLCLNPPVAGPANSADPRLVPDAIVGVGKGGIPSRLLPVGSAPWQMAGRGSTPGGFAWEDVIHGSAALTPGEVGAQPDESQ